MDYLSRIIEADDTVESWERKRNLIISRVMEIVGEPPVKETAPDAKVIDEVDCGKYIRRKITYAVDKDERIPAYILIPKKIPNPVPAVLCLHGTNMHGKDVPTGVVQAKPGRNYAHELAMRGYVTFSIDDPVMGERGKEIVGFDTSGFYKRFPDWSVVGKMAWDYGRGMDYLSTLEFVDSSKFGGIGHSLGATTLLFLAALDKRIAVSIASCGLGSWCPDVPGKAALVPDKGYIRLLKLKHYFQTNQPVPFDFHELIALVCPRALLRLSAYADPFVARADIIAESSYKIHQVYRLTGVAGNFAQYFHGDGHNFEPIPRGLAYAWIDKYLRRRNAQYDC